ncbi:hypothetical protein ACH518_07895 [Methylomonas sp. HW2-6]|uniref:hypothetical protein n=1 Tax=Methylomonas TaxID=416 RepID=UPI00112BA780|nr:hypothetical protein [Methylomonas koyamae]TPQ29258.1 hypothetical protein C2U68_02065 [Methylomonas koyamae]
MRYHPQALVIAILSATIGCNFVVKILFPEAGAKIAEALQSDTAPVLGVAAVLVLIALGLFVKSNRSTIDRVLTGRAEPAEVWRVFFKPSVARRRDPK